MLENLMMFIRVALMFSLNLATRVDLQFLSVVHSKKEMYCGNTGGSRLFSPLTYCMNSAETDMARTQIFIQGQNVTRQV